MKIFLLSAFRNFLLLAALLAPGMALAQAGQLVFTAHLTGGEEVPAVTTNAQGYLTVLVSDDRTTMLINGAISGLSGPATAAHFHTGNAGSNGPVTINLAPIRIGNRISGELPVPAGFVESALLLGIYVNVHTAANPGGEIRGQLQPESDLNFVTVLNGPEEVPPVLTTALGAGAVNITLGHQKVQYRFLVSGLSGPITAAHIHKGPKGVAGSVVVALTPSFPANRLIGELDLGALPADFLAQLFSGGYYVNVHTAANPGGEIRGQLAFGGYLNAFAFLNSDQETPPTTATQAFGIGFAVPNAKMDSVTYRVLVDGLSGPATAAHVHNAPGGTAGPVVFPLAPSPVPNLYVGTAPLSAVSLTNFVKNNLYFNVHTAANPGGEIRGQMLTNLRKAFTFDLCPEQEVPANTTTGYGAASVTIDQGNLALLYSVQVTGLSGPATAAHFHSAAAGVSGPVKFPIATPAPYSTGSISISGNDAVLIESGGVYLNVHTGTNPGGEIRGQVRRVLSCNPASSVFDPAVSDLEVYPNPFGEQLHLRFDSREAFDGTLRLLDVAGRVLTLQHTGVQGTGLQEIDIPLGHIAPGLYFLHLEREGQNVFVQTVVKM